MTEEARTPDPGKTDGSDGESPLDADVLADLFSLQEPGQDDVIGDMIDSYLQATPARLATLAKAAAAGDTQTLAWTAHSLKGSSGIFGALLFAKICEQLEIQSKNNTIEGAQALITRLHKEYERVRGSPDCVVSPLTPFTV